MMIQPSLNITEDAASEEQRNVWEERPRKNSPEEIVTSNAGHESLKIMCNGLDYGNMSALLDLCTCMAHVQCENKSIQQIVCIYNKNTEKKL